MVRKAKDDAWREFKTEKEAQPFALDISPCHFDVYEEV